LAVALKNQPSALKEIYWGQAYSKNIAEISKFSEEGIKDALNGYVWIIKTQGIQEGDFFALHFLCLYIALMVKALGM